MCAISKHIKSKNYILGINFLSKYFYILKERIIMIFHQICLNLFAMLWIRCEVLNPHPIQCEQAKQKLRFIV